MSVKGFQEFWLAGTRIYIERQKEDGSFEPMIDLGVIQTATPALAPEVVQLQDSDSGLRSVVDEGLAAVEETYEVVCSNFNQDNLSLFFLSDGVHDFTQPSVSRVAYLSGAPGRLLKIKRSATGDAEWGVQTIEGVYSPTGTPTAFLATAIDGGTKTITLDASHGDATAAFPALSRIILSATALDNITNAGTYEVVSSAFALGVTTVVVTETILTDTFGGGAGLVLAVVGGTVYEKGVDWDDHSLQRGIIQLLPGGAIVEGLVGVSWSTSALTGQRLINPQTARGPIKAKAYFVISRENFSRQTVREALVSITPSNMSLSVSEFSNMTLTFRVLNDLRLASPAGRLLHFRGSVPSLSDATESLD